MPSREAVISTITTFFSLLTITTYGGAIPYDTICSNNYYTIRGNDPVPSDTPHHYAWVVSSDGGASWQRIPNSNHRDLTITEPLSGMTNMQVRRYLYKRYIFSPQQTSQSEIVGLVMAKGYTLSRTIDTVTPCMDSKGFEISTPLPATFEWRCVESGKKIQPQNVTANSAKYRVRMVDLKSSDENLPNGHYSIEAAIHYAGGHVEILPLAVLTKPNTVSPFNFREITLGYGTSLWAMGNSWSGVDQQRWTLINNTVSGLTINQDNGTISGLTTVPFPSSVPDNRQIAIVDAVCVNAPDKHWQAILSLETTSAPTIPGSSSQTRDFAYTGGQQSVTLSAGVYRFECWGAQGGTMEPSWTGIGGRGGYTKGEITLSVPTAIHIFVGGQGQGYTTSTSNHYGGYNGGGSCYAGASGGGGASDIRLVANNLYSRIMVAGGGGGSNDNQNGGYGGGLTAGTGVCASGTAGTGGTQTSGGTGWLSGTFGNGAGAVNNYGDGGAGGGGYYGGGKANGYACAGGGGSSFISGYSGCNAVDASGRHTGQANHHSGKVFRNASMSNGVRAGNGLIRITGIILSTFKLSAI